MTLEGRVHAIMMTESTYYAYVYRDMGDGRFEPEQVEITYERYYQLLRENPALYIEPAYVAFEVDMEETIAGSDWHEWLGVQDTQDDFLAGTGRW